NGAMLGSNQLGADVEILGGRSFAKVSGARLYNVYKGTYGRHILVLKVQPGFSFNSFTFG
ncbi:MAG: hypothetical protein Q7S65_02805, partial [Nanoarchaeota archaeon]|nr:hypothetical protein [Nanoarchaeota archaeon]